ncbi:hypothetical protein BJY04DRAFT_213644 [Aspergillus karnatakaensis]|uniref:GMC family oxidoreductase n=1 Tax=Aspergillus karnatakaensis TaxID=1810916 RepID=UPI003CCE2C35
MVDNITVFEFIVVGSGPAGGVLASRLAEADSRPSVLLLEAGGPQPSNESLSLSNRWISDFAQPELNWAYVSLPEPELNNRSLDVSRGKALGGSSNINYLCWTPPTMDFIKEWQARIEGDPFFNWKDAKRLIDGLVNYNVFTLTGDDEHPLHGLTDVPLTKYPANALDYPNGAFDLTWSTYLKKGDFKLLSGAGEAGFLQNTDLVSGNSLGYAVMPSMASAEGYLRSTPSNVFLVDTPHNLVVKTGLEATRILFEGTTAHGVEVNGREQTFRAKNEIILSAGSINTPKILILSGVGPKAHLDELSIPLVADAPGVGQHLQDHYTLPFMWETDSDFADLPVAAVFDPVVTQDFFNAPVVFDRDVTMLSRSDAPNLEILAVNNWHPGYSPPKTPNLFLAAVGLAPQSEGSVTLPSSDWRDAPNIQFNLFSDENGLDLASAIPYTRQVLKMIEETDSVGPHILSSTIRPASDSDEDIMVFLRENTITLWHPARTTGMGPQNDQGDSVIDPSFRVRGVENLRVADLGVVPVMPNGHPASVALLIGACAAERIIADHFL